MPEQLVTWDETWAAWRAECRICRPQSPAAKARGSVILGRSSRRRYAEGLAGTHAEVAHGGR